ncbi:M23 family metallopeptidase [Streptomyces sp. ME19-01-6]|uniref:murein hydrolase activator EnvC family protein n=1 Tax=Streptomyces sp. ME19-01-6 TaxID=3028686 RepID=UPI0029BBB6F6|nr:M23 family metallopeptidase [Streptomyces sp. ME19-01-6]MDX3229377.1 M23 family metallopeptidase [Streptomyces sp. ME19-01-6]
MRPHTTAPAPGPAPGPPPLIFRALPTLLTLPFVVLLGLIPLLSAWPAAASAGVPAAMSGRAGVPAPAAGAADRDERTWPVRPEAGAGRPTVLRGWEPPATPWAAGHRGVDLAARTGRPVRAAAAGRVSFAGPVAGRGVLTIELSGTGRPPLRTTYEPVRPLVAKGDRVRAGQVVGVLGAGPFHCPSGCLHWGLRRGDRYQDPLSLLAPSMLGHGPSRLLPVFGVPEGPGAPERAGVLTGAGAPPAAGAPGVPHGADGRVPYALGPRTAGPSGPVGLAPPAVLAAAAAWAGVRLRRARAMGAGRVVLRGARRAGPW